MILDHHVTIYIPTTTDVNQPAEALGQELADAGLEKFARLFGGASRSQGQGAWVSQEHGLVVEDKHVVTSYCDRTTLLANLDVVLDFAKLVCRKMGQECVSVVVDGSMIFVDASTQPAAITARLAA